VVFRQPEPTIPPLFGVLRQIEGPAQRLAGITALWDRSQVED
jgi:hypothetical protein